MRVELPKEKVFPMPFRFWLILAVSIILPFFSGMHPAIFVFWLIGLWGVTARRGTTLRSADQKMFRYYSIYGIPLGSWEPIIPNAAVVILGEQQSVRQTSYAGVMRYQEREGVTLYLVNASHRVKLMLARVASRDELDPYLKVLEEEFNLKLVRFSPAISAKTKARRKR
ncbi:MAG: Uncharacterised protein [Flavobacteriales bacterium UBA4585]|jgi:hypothetical protein|nr:MAG: Uncharacterised protein [Flavobacteriales bacterium UBA4585]|tara:strand:- start:5610 stop:6116 length:507 start_codon:yes stop_codon:yes gene_type:complete